MAKRAYEILFAALGHLPGDPNVYTMLSTDLTEQGALFFTGWLLQRSPNRNLWQRPHQVII
ncbi:MAG TPA: hypothetical protein GX528_08500, partial [Firmicutes bacterium]|nr:hypothetical protein [Bacillota bacterium]